MATRLVGDELDLNLAPLAATLLVIIVVVLSDAGSLTLHPTRLGGGSAIADGVAVVNVVGGGLVVLLGNVGHFCRRHCKWYHEKGKNKVVEMLLKRSGGMFEGNMRWSLFHTDFFFPFS